MPFDSYLKYVTDCMECRKEQTNDWKSIRCEQHHKGLF
jgi:hypothetical protein